MVCFSLLSSMRLNAKWNPRMLQLAHQRGVPVDPLSNLSPAKLHSSQSQFLNLPQRYWLQSLGIFMLNNYHPQSFWRLSSEAKLNLKPQMAKKLQLVLKRVPVDHPSNPNPAKLHSSPPKQHKFLNLLQRYELQLLVLIFFFYVE